MKKPQFITAAEAAGMIENGKTIATVGMTLVSSAESVLKEIERSFLEIGTPKGLTLFHSCGQCDRERGIQHLAHEGLISRIIGSHWGLSPGWMYMISRNKVEAYCIPQGQMANMYHSMACREPGKITKFGINTFIDPRLEGGKMNDRTKQLEDISEIVVISGEEYIMYHHVPIDVLIIRGTYADEHGNISTREEAMRLEVLPAVLAAKRWNGKVIAQVKNVVRAGSLNPKEVAVPGVFVDAIVVCENPIEDHRQTHSWVYDGSYCGDLIAPPAANAPLALNMRKVIGRRAVMELKRNSVLNVGTGIPNDVIGPILIEEDVSNEVTITVESGIYGGSPAGGADFGISQNAAALITHNEQFDYYNGAGVDFTFMGAGEMDKAGYINATRMGDKAPGAGGFIDITSMAKHVIFCSGFTGKGLKVDFEGGQLNIRQEGGLKKLVESVQQISFDGRAAAKRGQKVWFVTERAVFRIDEEGPVLIEAAKGVDMQRDILAQIEFTPRIAEKIGEIPSAVYSPGAFGLKSIMRD